MPRAWVSVLLRLAGMVVLGALLGWYFDRVLVGVIAALLVALGWQLLWLYRLERWLAGRPMAFLPEGVAIWEQVFARIDFIRRRSRRRAKRFKRLARQLRHATRAFPDAGVILDENNEIVVLNDTAEEYLGLKNRDRGVRIENLVRDPDFVRFLAEWPENESLEIVSPVDSGRWLSCNLVPYGDQKMLLVRDVTEQHKSDQMRRDFVANASHELRTPLTVIAGYLDALVEDPGLSSDFAGPLAEMQRQTTRMRVLVEELLRLSELESDTAELEGEPVNMVAIADTARQEARSMPGCPQQVESRVDTDRTLRGEEKDIQSVVSNLVSNAVRYTPEDGRIEIRWTTDADGGYLSVSDTGAGIAREHLPRITERFYRVENGRERVGGEGGTGLGLSIVKHALLRHGATLEVRSELGRGSTFTCRFPAERIVPVA